MTLPPASTPAALTASLPWQPLPPRRPCFYLFNIPRGHCVNGLTLDTASPPSATLSHPLDPVFSSPHSLGSLCQPCSLDRASSYPGSLSLTPPSIFFPFPSTSSKVAVSAFTQYKTFIRVRQSNKKRWTPLTCLHAYVIKTKQRGIYCFSLSVPFRFWRQIVKRV